MFPVVCVVFSPVVCVKVGNFVVFCVVFCCFLHSIGRSR